MYDRESFEERMNHPRICAITEILRSCNPLPPPKDIGESYITAPTISPNYTLLKIEVHLQLRRSA